MSVKKGERKLSCNEAFHVAHQIKNELFNYVLTDLGIDTAKARNYPQVFINYITLSRDADSNKRFTNFTERIMEMTVIF